MDKNTPPFREILFQKMSQETTIDQTVEQVNEPVVEEPVEEQPVEVVVEKELPSPANISKLSKKARTFIANQVMDSYSLFFNQELPYNFIAHPFFNYEFVHDEMKERYIKSELEIKSLADFNQQWAEKKKGGRIFINGFVPIYVNESVTPRTVFYKNVDSAGKVTKMEQRVLYFAYYTDRERFLAGTYQFYENGDYELVFPDGIVRISDDHHLVSVLANFRYVELFCGAFGPIGINWAEEKNYLAQFLKETHEAVAANNLAVEIGDLYTTMEKQYSDPDGRMIESSSSNSLFALYLSNLGAIHGLLIEKTIKANYGKQPDDQRLYHSDMIDRIYRNWHRFFETDSIFYTPLK